MHPKARDALIEQSRAFEKKFGRAPGPRDPLWFDPDFDVPVQMAEQKSMIISHFIAILSMISVG